MIFFQNQLFQKILSGIQSVTNIFDPDLARQLSAKTNNRFFYKIYIEYLSIIMSFKLLLVDFI